MPHPAAPHSFSSSSSYSFSRAAGGNPKKNKSKKRRSSAASTTARGTGIPARVVNPTPGAQPLPLSPQKLALPPALPYPSPMPRERLPPHSEISKRTGAYLPHWTVDGAIYSITFRLADSLPAAVLAQWLNEREDIITTARQRGRPLAEHEQQRLDQLHSERVEAYLDAGHGACWLRQPAIAQIVADSLTHFDHQRYHLHAWCIMPNHVHVVAEMMAGHQLASVVHSWKSFTASTANRALGRTGPFWQVEYYDHINRGEGDYLHTLRYVAENPVKAGLKNWPWVWQAPRKAEE